MWYLLFERSVKIEGLVHAPNDAPEFGGLKASKVFEAVEDVFDQIKDLNRAFKDIRNGPASISEWNLQVLIVEVATFRDDLAKLLKETNDRKSGWMITFTSTEEPVEEKHLEIVKIAG